MQRLVIVHSFPGRAEEQAADRVLVAAERLGLRAAVALGTADIDAFSPDLVLCLSHHEGKTTSHPTYGLMMAPLSWYDHDAAVVARILSYDGYVTVSAPLAAWLTDLLASVGRPPAIAHYTCTLPSTAWRPSPATEPRLAYLGTNWDGWRHWTLFEALARRGYMRFHGPVDSWRHLDPAVYGGPLPFDRHSVLDAYRRAGVGLALDRPDFQPENLPSQRIYEITASGVVAIAGDLPFVREVYGDTVLYVDGTASPGVLVRQIDAHMGWIAANRAAATEMARAAHAIFDRDLSQERLLPNLLDLHARVVGTAASRPVPSRPAPSRPAHVRRIEILRDLLGDRTPDLATGTTIEADVPPFVGTAELEIHVQGAVGADALIEIDVAVGASPAGSSRIRLTGAGFRSIGDLGRARVPLGDVGPVRGPLRIGLRRLAGGPLRLAGLALRQGGEAAVAPLATLPPGRAAWIVGAARGGLQLARTLETLSPGVRLAGFIDDFVRGPLLDRPVVPLATAAAHVGPDDLLLIATQHWPMLWPRLLALRPAAIHTAHPGDGTGLVRLWPLDAQAAGADAK